MARTLTGESKQQPPARLKIRVLKHTRPAQRLSDHSTREYRVVYDSVMRRNLSAKLWRTYGREKARRPCKNILLE